MAQIDNIVQVFISRQTVQIDITSFDIPLMLIGMDDTIMAFATERVRTYTSLEEVADDFATTHPAYIMSTKLLSGDSKPATFKIAKVNKEVGEEETYVEALQAVLDLDDTWYALLADSHLEVDILALAATIQAMRKVYFTSSSDANATVSGNTTDIGSKLKAALYDRTIILYSLTANTDYPEAAWVGSQLIEVPGSNTWEYKRLLGVTVSVLSGTAITVLEGKGYNYYITVKGVPITRRGKTSGNSWVD